MLVCSAETAASEQKIDFKLKIMIYHQFCLAKRFQSLIVNTENILSFTDDLYEAYEMEVMRKRNEYLTTVRLKIHFTVDPHLNLRTLRHKEDNTPRCSYMHSGTLSYSHSGCLTFTMDSKIKPLLFMHSDVKILNSYFHSHSL